ncbi:hypothetical protein H257_06824 [Aphanomyces astaci]|uniref:Uncharacterized protein n=1 Tax=Aphanomyces astaci TaxID=112090 RepID=W4GIQ0_APHAT|nr:hypothetical protein H257_06824 [Aphanomyces astaci]ETV79560.1 hypothetical protein H257_06824 [Aphanomyces astaci]|eukprot:XP_009830496.1 hypothetical protein H257_06824 [Aphanomyces astaci]
MGSEACSSTVQVPFTAVTRVWKQERSRNAATADLPTLRKQKGTSSYIKPLLADDNKQARLGFAMSFLRPSSRGGHAFTNMHDVDEAMTQRAAKSKIYITMVIFLASVGRPHYDHTKKMLLDGKIGIWPFVEDLPAHRSSKSRPKGTLLQVSQNVNGDVYEAMVTGKDTSAYDHGYDTI